MINIHYKLAQTKPCSISNFIAFRLSIISFNLILIYLRRRDLHKDIHCRKRIKKFKAKYLIFFSLLNVSLWQNISDVKV